MKKSIIFILIIFLISVATASIEIFGGDVTDREIDITSAVSRIQTFLDLTDTPNSYSGEGANCVKVNVGETGLEFGSCTAGAGGDIESVQGDIYITNGSNSGAVNLIFNETKLNQTIDDRSINSYIDTQKTTNGFYLYNDTSTIFFNDTQLNITIDARATGGNASFNQSLTDSLYSSIIWNYNQTTPFTNWLATFVYNYNQTIPANAYTDSIVSSNNASWTSTYNATYAIWAYNQTSTSTASIGYYVNYTPITTTGNITNGTLKGYLAANAICNVYYSGSHMCQTGEILNSINRNQSNVNFTATFRITEGAPGYLANANDCDALISPSGSDLGAIWVGSTTHLSSYGSASLVSCSAARAIGCCI